MLKPAADLASDVGSVVPVLADPGDVRVWSDDEGRGRDQYAGKANRNAGDDVDGRRAVGKVREAVVAARLSAASPSVL